MFVLLQIVQKVWSIRPEPDLELLVKGFSDQTENVTTIFIFSPINLTENWKSINKSNHSSDAAGLNDRMLARSTEPSLSMFVLVHVNNSPRNIDFCAG